MLSYILARLSEPSSYAGLANLVALAGVHLAPEAWRDAIAAATALASLAALLLTDKGGSK